MTPPTFEEMEALETLSRWIGRILAILIFTFCVALLHVAYERRSVRTAKAAGDRAKIMHGPPRMGEVRP